MNAQRRLDFDQTGFYGMKLCPGAFRTAETAAAGDTFAALLAGALAASNTANNAHNDPADNFQ